MKRLFLLDAMALIFRAFYALNKTPRINSKGLNTSAIIGFANSLYDILKNEKPSHIAVAFESLTPTVRHIAYPEYKSTREQAPEDLITAIPYIIKLIEAFNIPVLMADGYEADDVIGTLAKKAESKGYTTYIMTTDKDFSQLVSPKIFVYKPAKFGNKTEILGIEQVCAKYNIKSPEQVIDILGLWGDASDNIPGVPGIGEVNASKLISEFGSVENLLQNTALLKGKIKDNLINFADQALLSKSLATIITNVPIDFDELSFELKAPDKENLKTLFDELEFKTFAQRVFNDMQTLYSSAKQQNQLFEQDSASQDLNNQIATNLLKNINTVEHNYILIESPQQRADLIDLLSQQSAFCFDTETTGLDSNISEIVGIAFAFQSNSAYYLSLTDNYNSTYKILQEFKALFENKSIIKIGQNLKFDMLILRWYDIEVKGELFDTMLAHYLIQPEHRHNLNYLSETYLNYQPVSIESLIGKKGKNQLSMQTVPIEQIKDYTCEDADITLQLKIHLEKELFDSNLVNIFKTIETPLIPVLCSMEFEGVKINSDTLNEYSIQLQKEISEIEKAIYSYSGEQFNIASPKQLGDILFDKMKLIDNPKKTATKQYSTNEEFLRKIFNTHPIIEKILEYRTLSKLKSTYVDSLPLLVNPRTKRIHTSYNQAVVATGRLSSNNPNLQNIPVRTDKGKEIRKAFIPRNENYILLSADYSQIELRLMAHLSKDLSMIEAFNNNIDIHKATAAKIFNIPPEQINSDQRRKAKTVNFGIIYGISAFGLSERINIPRREAAEIIENYFINFPAIKEYMAETIKFAKTNAYVETILGRRRYISNINSNNSVVRGYAERNAINARIQGTAADMIKIAMIDIYNKFNNASLKSKMIMQIHDELVFDIYKDELLMARDIIENSMKNTIKLDIPIEIDINTGANWLEAH